MAEILYKCNLCNNSILKLIYKKEDYRGFMLCANRVFTGPKGQEANSDYAHCWQTCHGVLERAPLKAPQVTVVETFDNGIMPKRVHCHKDIKEILKKRSKINPTKKD